VGSGALSAGRAGGFSGRAPPPCLSFLTASRDAGPNLFQAMGGGAGKTPSSSALESAGCAAAGLGEKETVRDQPTIEGRGRFLQGSPAPPSGSAASRLRLSRQHRADRRSVQAALPYLSSATLSRLVFRNKLRGLEAKISLERGGRFKPARKLRCGLAGKRLLRASLASLSFSRRGKRRIAARRREQRVTSTS